jgi:hypothetical protein
MLQALSQEYTGWGAAACHVLVERLGVSHAELSSSSGWGPRWPASWVSPLAGLIGEPGA